MNILKVRTGGVGILMAILLLFQHKVQVSSLTIFEKN